VTDDFYPLVGLGLVHNGYSGAVSGSDTGASGLLGLKTYFSERWAFRADVSLDMVSTAFNEGSDVNGTPVSGHLNWSFTGGVSMDIGPGRYRDADGDAVHDRADLCPETPTGVSVDEAGCRLDEDADRVWDEDDLCPLTPDGVAVDEVGCRVDADHDGVFDEDDACPATPAGVTVGTTGCPIDTDRDRVPDHLDECADTPFGVSVDGTGCRVDTDADGVWDEDDLCPGTATGTAVDPTGCAILFEEERAVLVLQGVNFGSWSSELNDEARAILNEVADALVANPDVRIRVNGHTDSTGTRGENVRLSQERADAVMDYLIERGVTPDRLEAQGFGPDMPIATNDTAEGRQENRRVELERIDPGG
jgi:outer membrane protein OmpA-like peptidoglycan-associated protein